MNKQSLRRSLSKRILLRYLRDAVIYTVLILVLSALALWISTRFLWYETTPFYKAFSWMNHNRITTIVLLIAVGNLLLLLECLLRTLRNVEEIVQATERAQLVDGELLTLSPELTEVEQRLNQLMLEGRENAHRAREAEQRKNDLVVYLAHDLKTPLTSVIGYLSLLMESEDLPEDIRKKYTGIALDKAERLEDLINEFFEITRFNLTSLSLEYSTVDLSRMLEQTVFEFQPLLEERHLSCGLEKPERLMIHCDPGKLQRVFDNLMRNAVSYSYEGGAIEWKLRAENGFAVVTCTNPGPTVPQEKLNRLFEQFFRLDTSRTSRTGGSGLGLAIAKQIVECHQGTITAKSAEESMCFTVRLPLASSAVQWKTEG